MALSDPDRLFALQQLRQSLQAFLDATAQLSPDQWDFRPHPDQWSVTDCAVHLALTERAIVARVQQVLSGPPGPPAEDPTKGDSRLLRLIPDRSRKVTGPAAVAPQGKITYHQAKVDFEEARQATIEFADTTAADLRAYGFPHFVLGPMDALQWLLFLSAHTNRHVLQIGEIVAASDPETRAG